MKYITILIGFAIIINQTAAMDLIILTDQKISASVSEGALIAELQNYFDENKIERTAMQCIKLYFLSNGNEIHQITGIFLTTHKSKQSSEQEPWILSFDKNGKYKPNPSVVTISTGSTTGTSFIGETLYSVFH